MKRFLPARNIDLLGHRSWRCGETREIGLGGRSCGSTCCRSSRAEFPDMTGFSARNVWDMKRLFLAYSDGKIWPLVALGPPNQLAKVSGSRIRKSPSEFLRQLVAEIPWGQHLMILNKISDPNARLYYLRATAQCGWSRSVLLNHGKG